jgi:hypothetical protein
MYTVPENQRQAELSIIRNKVELARVAVQWCSENDEHKAHNLDNLACWLRRQDKIAKDDALLTEAASCSRKATTIFSQDHPYWPIRMCNLATILKQQYDAGDAKSLDEALLVARTAVENIRDNHPDKAACLAVLGNILRVEWRRKGQWVILSEAFDRAEEAVVRTVKGDPCLANRVELLKLLCDEETRETR